MKYGWTAFTRNAAPFLVLTVVSLVMGVGISGMTNLVTTGSLLGIQDTGVATGVGEVLLMQAVSLAGSFVTTFLGWLIGVAMMRGAIDVVDTGRTDLGAMFTRVNWGAAIGAAILATVAIWIGFAMCILPGLVFAFLLWFTTPSVIDGESAVGALEESYRFTSGHLGDTLLFLLLCIALIVAGVCTLGLGLLVATPVMTLGMAYTWRVLQRRPVAV